MSGTNAIHGIVVLGALIVLGALPADANWGVRIITFVALVFGTLNVVGGFLVTDRMLGMFKGRKAVAARDGDAGAKEIAK
jgi:NAD(P) transhydrogenase subunit alpha